MSDIGDDIERAQTIIELTYGKQYNYNIFEYPGLWDDKIRLLAYEYLQSNFKKFLDAQYDHLGYIDKDIEKRFTYSLPVSDSSGRVDKVISNSISDIDIYAEDNYKRRVLNYGRNR